MKRFVLQEKRWDSRFDSKLLAGKAYADAADHYLPESVSRNLRRDEKVLLMVISERLQMHPIDVLNEGFMDTAKNWINKITKYSKADPETEAEMQKIKKRKKGFFKRFSQARGDQSSIFQSIKYGLGDLWPQVSAAGETFIPGLQGKAKLKAQAEMNLSYKKLKKQLTNELKDVWGRLGAALEKMPDPDEGGFPNNPNPKDFVQIMYGEGFETMDEVDAALKGATPRLGGLVGSILSTRDSLQQFIDDRIISKAQAEKLMKKPLELFASFKGSLERQYFTLENNNGKDGPLLHRISMNDLMFEDVRTIEPEVVIDELENLTLDDLGIEEAPPDLTAEEEEELSNITPDQMKSIFAGDIEDSGIDVDIIEKTQMAKKANKFIAAAAITAIAAALLYMYGQNEESKRAILKVKKEFLEETPESLRDIGLQDESFDMGEKTIEEFTSHEELQNVFEIHSGDGLTYLKWDDISDLSNEEIQKLDYDKWSGDLFKQFGDSKESWIQAMEGKMSDPAQAWEDLHNAQGKGLSVGETFRPDGQDGPLPFGADGKASFSLLKTGMVSFTKKFVTKKVKTVLRDVVTTYATNPQKVVKDVIVGKAAISTAGGIAVAAAPWVLGGAAALLAIGLVRKYKDSREKQLQAVVDKIIKRPFIEPPPAEDPSTPNWPEIGVDPDVVPPEPENPREPIEDPEVAASLDLVKRALKKSGYPEKDIDPLLNSLWDGVDPNPKAPERLTTDSEQEMLRTSAWKKYSLMPLMTESPAALLLMEDDVKFKKFTEYMTKAAKHAKVQKPNKKQIEQAAFAFNIANGIGDVSDMPEKYKKAENSKKLKKLQKRLKELEKENDGMVKKKWKKKAKNRKAVIDDLEDTVDKFKGKYGKAKEKLGKALDDLEAGKIQMSEYLEQIQAMEEDRELTFNQTEQLRMDLEAQIDALTQAKDEESLRLSGEINKMADELKGFEGAITKDMQEELMDAIQGSMGEEVDPTIFFSNPMGYINTWMDNAKGDSEKKQKELEDRLENLEPELDNLRKQLADFQDASKKGIKIKSMYKFMRKLKKIMDDGSNKKYGKKLDFGEKNYKDLGDKTQKAFDDMSKDVKNKLRGELGLQVSHRSREGDLLREQKEVVQTLSRWQKLAGLK